MQNQKNGLKHVSQMRPAGRGTTPQQIPVRATPGSPSVQATFNPAPASPMPSGMQSLQARHLNKLSAALPNVQQSKPDANFITPRQASSDREKRIVEDRTISQDDTGGDVARESRMLAALGRGQVSPELSNHALQDYQMQLMLLESQNKKRLLLARQEADWAEKSPAQNVPALAPSVPSSHPQDPFTGMPAPSTGPFGEIQNETFPYHCDPHVENFDVDMFLNATGEPTQDQHSLHPSQPLECHPLDSSQVNHTGKAGTEQNRDMYHGGVSAALDAVIEQIKGMPGWKQALADRLSLVQNPPGSESEHAFPWPVLHRIDCPLGGNAMATYMDAPKWVLVENHYHLDGRQRIVDESMWERAQKDAPFVVYLTYSCTLHGHTSTDRKEQQTVVPVTSVVAKAHDHMQVILSQHLHECCKHPQSPLNLPIPKKEEIRFLSQNLRAVMQEAFVKDHLLLLYQPMNFSATWTLEAPYLVNYHCRKQLEEGVNTFASACKSEFSLVLDYLQRQTDEHEARANQMFEKGEVTPDLIPYLFGPHELLTLGKASLMIAIKSTSLVKSAIHLGWELSCEYIGFTGEFGAFSREVDFHYPNSEGTPVKIQDLKIFPLKYADKERIEYLRKRGELFYSCSEGKYVTGPESYRSDVSNTRYMVDVKTYRMMHAKPDPVVFSRIIDKSHADDFILRLPGKINGFHMLDKKWVDLAVDQLKPVEWDMEAFENLAVDNNTKELIQAVVTNKIEADKGTDLVSGKGNGLIVLLHGGPGTGKTLTAESVAEIAQKPLYRVSCGDVGTDPHRVEEYLESVFVLGRRWGCVVLLDEADVFLEQRSFANLERNALVSVFLRVLEYYDGILLLTSNRVGTFDEAFKSRIQLAIHYDSLSGAQRHQIWGNFIKRLEDLQEEMDVDDVRDNLEKLSKFALNGRQIRNVVTTARQLARYRKEKMNFTHLERAINVSSKFEKYLLALHDYEPDDERARAEGLR